MTRMIRSLSLIAGLLIAPTFAFAQAPQGTGAQKDVAAAFIAAARAQDRQATLQLLDSEVFIEFPATPDQSPPGRGEGQPFVIGYLDGLFDADHGLSLDSSDANGDAVRFLAHDDRSKARYAIDVEVRNQRVVRVTVNLEAGAGAGQAVAALGPS